MVALQGLPNVAPEITTLSPSKKDLNKFLGIEQSKRARPQSLAMGGDGSPNSARQMKLNQLKALNKTLSRLTSNSSMVAQSAPTTPDNYPYSILGCDENLSPLKKKNLHKFLGLPPPPPPVPPPRTASSVKRRAMQDPPPSMLKMTSVLSSSTPDDLEKENAAIDELRRLSQSNDGLATPGSCTTPAKGPAIIPQPFCRTVVVPVVGPKPSNSMFSLATASHSLPRPQFQPARPVVQRRPNPLSCSLQRGATMIHGHNYTHHFQRLPPQPTNVVPQSRTLPRSITLDDMEPVAAVNWVQRPPTSTAVRRHSSLLQPKSILKDSQNNHAARRSHSSASSAYFMPGPAPQWPPPPPQSCSCRAEAAQQPIREPIYVTMGPNLNRQHRHSIGMGYVPPTVLTLNPPPSNKATTTVMVNGGDDLDMSDVRVKTTAIVHNEPAMFCHNTSNQKTVVQIRGEGEGAVSRMDSELEETI